MKTPSLLRRALSLSTLTLFLPAMAAAQQTPVTGRMMAPGATAPQAAGATASAPSQVVGAPSAAGRTRSSAAGGSPAMAAPSARTDAVSAGVAPLAGQRMHATAIGETTRSLLQMQVDGAQAGKHLPMLGAEASVSYDRYLKSFSHDIPEFYKTAVGKDSNGSAGGQ